MKILNLLLIVFALSIVSCNNTNDSIIETDQNAEESISLKDGAFIHVSSGYDNPQKALMAVSLAVKLAESQDVILFFDIKGVKLLTKTSEDIDMESFLTLHGALDKLIEQNIQIMACPMCMKKAGIEPEDLREGVIVAEGEKFFNFTKGRILTLDY
ncbi:MAG: peroxiredoxin [Bacteroidales bacterium]|nr:peroxiredoxin [Bacteroidales bacterium]